MTQSGQGEEPSQRVAREGIVLPSDGGEPLLPGMTGGPVGRPVPAQTPPPPAPSAPQSGQSWGTPWGPEQQTPAPQPGEGWGGAQAGQTWGTPGPYQAQPDAYQAPVQQDQYGAPAQPDPYQAQAPAPAYDADQPTSYYLPPVEQPLAATPGYDTDQATSYYLPPATGAPAGQQGASTGVPLPPVDEGATQYIPPVAPQPSYPQQRQPYQQPPADEGATQYIPPVGPGALPPEVPVAGGAGEHTQFLGHAPQGGAGPLPPVAGPDAQATQYIPPVPGQYGDGLSQPPSEFDNLFRSEPAGAADSTQHLPRFEPAAPQPSYADQGHEERRGRSRSRVPVIAAVGIGIAALGIGAGALMAGGGGDDDGDDNQTVSATAPATEGSASASADEAKEQAEALDKLLADSGDSRTSVINAVANVKACKDLGQAGTDLRNAATQRNDLVTKLGELAVDKLPNHSELTTALTKAWQASASADTHYAAWADQVAAKKGGCKKGQARSTAQTQAGNRASGEATTHKKTAAQLWNTIAKQYGLTERTYTQL